MPESRQPLDVRVVWRALSQDPAAVFLDGFHATKHALRFGADIPLIVAADKPETLALARALAPDLAAAFADRVVEISDDLYRELMPKRHPTATAAWARRPVPRRNADRGSPIVLLDNPRNLGNVGAVVRLAAGMGCSGVLTTGDMDPWHPQVVRGSAGLHFAVPVAQTDIGSLPPGPLFALDADGDDLRGVPIPGNALLAFGSERHGISAELRDRADMLLSIPMREGVSSYNLATSVAMVLYHWVAQRPPIR
jgi:TrmH family RNA methyltransferase